MKIKSKICWSAVLAVCVFFFTIPAEAQIYTPSGVVLNTTGPTTTNVGVGVSNPGSLLSVGGVGSGRHILYVERPAVSFGGSGIYSYSLGTTDFSSSANAIYGNVVGGLGYTYGVRGRSYTGTASGSGRSYGVYGEAGNSSINYGVYGTLLGTNRGAGVFGTNQGSTGAVFNGSWAGYFVGEVKMTTSLSIGKTDAPSGYILAVDGKAIAEEVRVEMSNFWDEVFEEDYDLMSMEEKEAFTKANKHLPSFAPEAEIVANGIEVGASYANMAKELEEAYQYIFELNKLIKELRAENQEIKAMLEKISE